MSLSHSSNTTKEIVGYVFRTLSAKVDPYRVAFFVVQYFCMSYPFLVHINHKAIPKLTKPKSLWSHPSSSPQPSTQSSPF
jgi:hypothetical protein